ncbi:MAG TPA: rRNA adenine N-6-methyltransferase family protein [Candidatus Saccharimonadaceae bacterium]|nr:rRNA adenine N-6-methyltransferase family protein [Candidatus Saccharimonadaceae bacterium]
MKRLSSYDQHFLRSPRLVAELIGHTNIRKNDTVYDLGAGSGVITSVLAWRCGQVFAVENEPGALIKLRQNTAQHDNVTVIARDILGLNIPTGSYKIFANIPFSLSAKIVRKFTDTGNPPKAIYLVVQRQFALKLVPSERHFTSELGAEIGALYAARIRRPLHRSDFTPPPAVDTVLLELKLRERPLVALEQLRQYRAFVTRCFAEQKYFQSQPRSRIGVSPERKPSELTLDQWAKLFDASKPPKT